MKLMNAEQQHAKHPTTFEIPDRSKRAAVRSGDIVKLAFISAEGSGERMWVKVIECVEGRAYVGVLTNCPLFLPLRDGEIVRFGPEHVLDIWPSNAV
jgi:hypothetical protein